MRNLIMLSSAVLVACVPSLSSAEVLISAGVNASSGQYGSRRDTTMITAPVQVRWTDGAASLSVVVPFVTIRSPGVVFSGLDGTPIVMLPDAGGPSRRYSDLGDATLSAGYAFVLPSDFRLTATGRVKVPFQGRTSVSTGKTDWLVGAEVSKAFGPVTPFASVSYRVFGDTSVWNIRDGIATSVGASVPLGGGAVAVSYDHARSTSRFVNDVHEIVAAYDAPVSSRFRISVFGSAGLSSGAPSAGAGLRLTARL